MCKCFSFGVKLRSFLVCCSLASHPVMWRVLLLTTSHITWWWKVGGSQPPGQDVSVRPAVGQKHWRVLLKQEQFLTLKEVFCSHSSIFFFLSFVSNFWVCFLSVIDPDRHRLIVLICSELRPVNHHVTSRDSRKPLEHLGWLIRGLKLVPPGCVDQCEGSKVIHH